MFLMVVCMMLKKMNLSYVSQFTNINIITIYQEIAKDIVLKMIMIVLKIIIIIIIYQEMAFNIALKEVMNALMIILI